MVSVFGNLILASSFIFIGPLPSIQIVPTWRSITVATGFVALGYGCVMVSTFGRALRKGFEKDIETYLLISGILFYNTF